MARASLKAFLTSAQAALKAPAASRTSPLTFVVGNESADLDSLCCAFVYAYIRSHTPPHTLHIPLANLPRPDLALRTEMAAALELAGLSLTDMPTLSELPDIKPEDTRWLLVDHNALTGPLEKYSGQILGCIDHHVDEGTIPLQASPRVIEPCGSCMSLVIDESRAAWDAISSQETEGPSAADEDEKLAKLGLTAILLDTINLTAKDKIRDKDPKSVSYLESKIKDKSFDRKALFDHISAVKEDISGLSLRDIFRKDYKQWEEAGIRLGISCAVQGFQFLLDKAESKDVLLTKFAEWAEERELDVASIMTTLHPGGEFQRQLLVWGRTDKGVAALEKFIDISGRLQLEPWQGGEFNEQGRRMAWRQRDLTASRKQVAPLLKEALKKVGTSHL